MDLVDSIEEAVSLEDGDSSHEERATANNDEEEPLISSLRKKLNDLSKRPNTTDGPTIFRVPANLRKNKEDLIEPSVVSIGPYHRDCKRLAPMEDKKLLLLQEMLSNLKGKVTLEACIAKVNGVQLQARFCYSERVDMDDDSFVEMLILDGTFIIQYMCIPDDWFKRESGWASDCIETDLIMLENQIPFFVVQSLWDLYFPGSPLLDPEGLDYFRDRFCPNFELGNNDIPQNRLHHLLHLCHHCVVPNMSAHQTIVQVCSNHEKSELHEYVIPCATELKETGIKFRKKKSPCNMIDVTFQGDKLEIPPIQIDDQIRPIFMNLLAFEQSQTDYVPKHLSSYAAFMDSIINTEHDVAILQRYIWYYRKYAFK